MAASEHLCLISAEQSTQAATGRLLLSTDNYSDKREFPLLRRLRRAMNIVMPADVAREQQVKVFTIQNETNNIAIHTTVQEASGLANATRFRSEASFTRLAAVWPHRG